jgi:O-antigen/teichoic acid export membrane protein
LRLQGRVPGGEHGAGPAPGIDNLNLSGRLLAGWTNAAVTALVNLGMVPVYLHLLGSEAYGLIGFFTTALSLMQVFDLGLATTVNREVARAWAAGRAHDAAPLVRLLGLVYGAVAAATALAAMAAAPFLTRHWLRPSVLAPEQITTALALMGLALAVRWPIGLFQAALFGGQRQAQASVIGIATTLLTAAGALTLLLWRPDVQVLFAWYSAVGLAQLAWLRQAAWAALGGVPQRRGDWAQLLSLWRFSAAVAGINAIGLWFMQFDKVLLSTMLPLAQYGHYMIAVAVANAMYVMVTPVFQTVYPRFTALHAAGESARLQRLYRLLTTLVAAIAFPLAMLLILWGQGIVALWTGDASLAAEVAPVLALLAAGSGLHTVMFILYANQLAMGAAALALRISLGLLVVQAPMVWLLTLRWGATGAAAAWLALHVIYLLSGSWITHRRLLPQVAGSWLARDVGAPLLICGALGAAAWYGLRGIAHQSAGWMLGGLGLAGVASALVLLSSAGIREYVRAALGGRGFRAKEAA